MNALVTLFALNALVALVTLFALNALVALVAFFALNSLCAVIAYHSAEIHSCSVAVCYNKLAESIYFTACNAYAVGAVRAVDTCVAFFTFDALATLVAFFAFFALNSLCAVVADYLAEIYRVTVAVCYDKLTESIYFAACNAYAVGAIRAVFTVCTVEA